MFLLMTFWYKIVQETAGQAATKTFSLTCNQSNRTRFCVHFTLYEDKQNPFKKGLRPP